MLHLFQLAFLIRFQHRPASAVVQRDGSAGVGRESVRADLASIDLRERQPAAISVRTLQLVKGIVIECGSWIACSLGRAYATFCRAIVRNKRAGTACTSRHTILIGRLPSWAMYSHGPRK